MQKEQISSIQNAKAVSMLTKKRYNELDERIKSLLDPKQADSIMESIRDVMHFDPTLKIYTPKHAQNVANYRKKLKELGIPRCDRRRPQVIQETNTTT